MEAPERWEGVGSEHFHPSRYPHADGIAIPGEPDISAIRCKGATIEDCISNRVSGEISRMMEFEFRKLGGNPQDIIARHQREHPDEWEPIHS